MPPYAPLLCHASAKQLSSLQLDARTWRCRVAVVPEGASEEHSCVYEFTMVQRLGGVYDGYFFTESLVADGNDWAFLKFDLNRAC